MVCRCRDTWQVGKHGPNGTTWQANRRPLARAGPAASFPDHFATGTIPLAKWPGAGTCLAGSSTSTNLLTANANQGSNAGGEDALVAEVGTPPSTTGGTSGDPISTNSFVTGIQNVTLPGTSAASATITVYRTNPHFSRRRTATAVPALCARPSPWARPRSGW